MPPAAEEKSQPHPRAYLSPDVTFVSGNNFFKAVGLHLRKPTPPMAELTFARLSAAFETIIIS